MKSNASYLGDLLITFGLPLNAPISRFTSAPFWLEKDNTNWQVWKNPASENWKGFPFQEHETDTWKIYTLGEIRSEWNKDQFEKNIAALNGQFLILAYERSTRRWHVWTDRFGTLHIYYSPKSIGTFSPAVAAFSNKKLDWLALTGFFGFGFFPQDRTHYEDVSIIPPASHYVFDEHGALIQKEKYWQWHHTPNLNRSYDDTVAEFASIFKQVMSESLEGGRAAIPLSGGLDSRSSIAPVDLNLNNAWAYSYGYSNDSIETKIARQAANARALPFEAFTIQPYLFDNLERILAWTEGFQDITQPRQAYVRDEIASHADILIAALWGDVWLDETGLANHAADSLPADLIAAHALNKIKKSGRGWLQGNLIQPRQTGYDPEAVLADLVRAPMHSLEHIADPDFRVKAFKTENWSFRWSLTPIRVFQSAAQPRLIFYDNRLADFFCTVPSKFLIGRRLQIDYLKRFAPDLARITWQVYDANLYQYEGFNTWLLPKRAVKKIGRMLNNKPVLQRNWEVQFLSPQGRANLEKHLTRSGLRLHEFVSPVAIKSLLETFHQSPTAAQGYTVSMLLTFSAWLEQYG